MKFPSFTQEEIAFNFPLNSINRELNQQFALQITLQMKLCSVHIFDLNLLPLVVKCQFDQMKIPAGMTGTKKWLAETEVPESESCFFQMNHSLLCIVIVWLTDCLESNFFHGAVSSSKEGTN